MPVAQCNPIPKPEAYNRSSISATEFERDISLDEKCKELNRVKLRSRKAFSQQQESNDSNLLERHFVTRNSKREQHRKRKTNFVQCVQT